MSSNEIALIFYAISIIVIFIAGAIVASTVIPLQWKEAEVKNGLRTLRKQMLAKGLLTLTIVTAALIALTIRYFITDLDLARIIISGLVICFALSLLGKALIDYKIYHQSYTPENKKLHEKFEVLEEKIAHDKREDMDIKNKKARAKRLIDKTAEKRVK